MEYRRIEASDQHMPDPKYDVAISFLSADESIAAALANALTDGLEVFFYPRKQEELAGTEGLESLRKPFVDDSRIVVVLYRNPWGETPWTRVEEAAIKDGCLKHGWQRLFFIMLENGNPPKWVPHTHIRFNYADYGLEQAVGAIKARVQEVGGVLAPVTAVKRAGLARVETEYQRNREHYRSPFGGDAVRAERSRLFEMIRTICDQVNASGSAAIQVASDQSQVHLRSTRVSLLVGLDSHSSPRLVVQGFNRRLAMGNEHLFYPDGQPKRVRKTVFLPDLNRAGEHGWSENRSESKFLTSQALADQIVSDFIDLAARGDRGEFTPKDPL